MRFEIQRVTEGRSVYYRMKHCSNGAILGTGRTHEQCVLDVIKTVLAAVPADEPIRPPRRAHGAC